MLGPYRYTLSEVEGCGGLVGPKYFLQILIPEPSEYYLTVYMSILPCEYYVIPPISPKPFSAYIPPR